MSRERDRVQELEMRIKFLEERIRALRFSRRVLMDLLAIKERQRAAEQNLLAEQNRRLQKKNARYAHQILQIYRQKSKVT